MWVPSPGVGRSPGGGNGNPFEYSCLGNPTERGAWWARVHGIARSWTRLSTPSSVLRLLVVSSVRIRQCLRGTWMWGMALPSGVAYLTGPESAEGSRATLRKAQERKPVLSADAAGWGPPVTDVHSPQFWARGPRSQCQQIGLGETPLPDLQTAIFSLCP